MPCRSPTIIWPIGRGRASKIVTGLQEEPCARNCALAARLVCKSSGFLCSFRATALMRSRVNHKLATGDAVVRSQASSIPHADCQTCPRCLDLVRRNGLRLRRGQQERSLSDLDARPRECRPVGSEYCRARGPGPVRSLARRYGRKTADPVVVRAAAGDGVRARLVRGTQARCFANRVDTGAGSWAALHGGLFILSRRRRPCRERPDRGYLRHQAQHRGKDSGGAEIRNCDASGHAPRCGPATSDRCCRSGGRYRLASVAALEQTASVIHAGQPSVRYQSRKGKGVRSGSRTGTGGTRRQLQFGAGAGSEARSKAQSVRFQHPDRISRDLRRSGHRGRYRQILYPWAGGIRRRRNREALSGTGAGPRRYPPFQRRSGNASG